GARPGGIDMHELIFLDPGHFHAALTLRASNPAVADAIKVFARPGPELDAFLSLVEAFNTRERDATRWQVQVHHDEDPLRALLDRCTGGNVIIAGRNDLKLERIAALHDAGFAVFADKPWLVSPAALPLLERATSGPPLAMDIMTNRVDRFARLRQQVVADAELFGEFVDDGEPAIDMQTLHHLYKRVNGRPLTRPPWYFDVRVQGDGLTDIQSHLVDQVQWLTGHLRSAEADIGLRLLTAQRWPTPVPLELFRDCTGHARFADELASAIDPHGVLQLQCNGIIEYRANGVRVRQRAEWLQKEPEGSGDQHQARIRGTRCEVLSSLGPQTGFKPTLLVRAAPGAALDAALERAVQRWQDDHPGVAARACGPGEWRIELPAGLEGGHESHFPIVLDEFLRRAYGEQCDIEILARRIRARYGLLGEAQQAVLTG
ncbi:MAG: hypothetical protein KDK91_33915, partial [Gammaproteobacteria bacterium]|nr:hypothetical protein [Gammaproteobacteria bacterium]